MNNQNLINNLKNNNLGDFEKIYSIVELNNFENKQDADLFLFYLTNQANPIREAIAYKFEELTNYSYFYDENSLNILINSICDINPNVVRSICTGIEKDEKLKNLLEEKIIIKIEEFLKSLDNEDKFNNNKNHAKNKKIFSLYWLLEAFSICVTKKYNSRVLEILKSTIKFKDYTIREKTAKILWKMGSIPNELKEDIKKETNFYVNFYLNQLSL